MAELKKKIENLTKMLNALEKSIDKLQHNSDQDDIEYVQDSVVARFKILVDSFWKFLKIYLEEQGFLEVPSSPKGVVHFARENNVVSSQEHDLFIQYLSLRNVASHIYDQAQYLLVVETAPAGSSFFKKLLERMAIAKRV